MVLGSSDFEDTGVAPNFEQMVLVAEPATLTAIALVNTMTNTILCAINTRIDQKLNATKEELTATMKNELAAVKDHIMDQQQLKATKEELVDSRSRSSSMSSHRKESIIDMERDLSISMELDERDINELLAKMKNGLIKDQQQLKATKEELVDSRSRSSSMSSHRKKNIIRMERKATKEDLVGTMKKKEFVVAMSDAMITRMDGLLINATKEEFLISMKEFVVAMSDTMNTRIDGLLNATKEETAATNHRIVTMNTQMDGQFKAMKDEFVALNDGMNDRMDRLLKAIQDEITAMRIHMDDQFKTMLVDWSL
jgi:hypothetical protein